MALMFYQASQSTASTMQNGETIAALVEDCSKYARFCSTILKVFALIKAATSKQSLSMHFIFGPNSSA